MTGVAGGTAGGGDAGGQAQAGDGGQAVESQTSVQGLGEAADILSSLADGQSQLQQQFRSFLESEPWKPEPAPEPEPDLTPYLDVADPNFDPNTAAQQITQQMQAYADQRVQEALAPFEQKINAFTERQAVLEMIGQYPELGDQATLEKVLPTVHQKAQAIGRPDLGTNPEFIGLVYAASMAHDRATQEGAQQPQAAHLEGGGGAGPATGQQVNPADSWGDVRPRRVLPF